MTALTENIESSKHAQQLRQECMDSIPHRRGKEILLLAYFLIMFTIIVVYLWVNVLIYDFWFFILLGLISVTFLAGYLVEPRVKHSTSPAEIFRISYAAKASLWRWL